VLRSAVTTWSQRVGDTITVNAILDPRGTPIGAAALAVDVSLAPVTLIFSTPAGPPAPIVNFTSGVFRISVGSANGIGSALQVLNLRVVGRATGIVGYVYLYMLDVSAVDGSNITALTTSTRVPIVIR
jgi:hypothetical protein